MTALFAPAVSAAPLTLSAHVNAWLDRRANHKAPRTTDTYGNVMRLHVLPHLGPLRLGDVTAAGIVEVLDGLARRRRPRSNKRYAARTVRLTYTALHAALADAVEGQLLATNPAAGLSQRYPIPKDEAPCYTREESLCFLRAAILYSADWAYFFAVMFGAGLRVGEARALQRWDVRLERKEIRVVRSVDRHTGIVNEWTKGKRSRTVPVMESLVTPLTELLGARQGRWLFPEAHGRQGYKRAWDAFREIAERADLTIYSPKAFRHSFGSTLAEVGVDLRAIQDAMGHADSRTTLRYAGHFPVRRSPQLDEL